MSLVLGVCSAASALNPNLDITQFGHTAWTVRDGFFTGGITAIAQAADGYLWLATPDGLVRFDGVRAVPWHPPADQSLPRGLVHALLAARDGALWIGMHSGLSRWDGHRLVANERLAGQLVAGLAEDRDGTLWVSTGYPPGLLCAVRGATTECVGEDGRFGDSVGVVFEDSHRQLWVSAANGLWRWTPDRALVLPGRGGASAWTETVDGVVLGARGGQILQVGGNSAEPLPLPRAGTEPTMTALLTDKDGSVWIGTAEHGLLHRHRDGRVDGFARRDGLSGNSVTAIFEDREANLWVATDDGLDRFRALSASMYSVSQGLSGRIGSVVVDRDNGVWASSSRGLYRLHGGRTYAYRVQPRGSDAPGVEEIVIPNLPEPPVGSLLQDRRGRMWLGSVSGLGYLEDGRFVRLAASQPGYVDSIAEDTDGNVWVAHRDAGLLRISAGGAVQQFAWAALKHGFTSWVWRVAADPLHGGVWLAYHAGRVARFGNGEIEASYSAADGLGSGAVHGIRVSADGTVWAATDGGLTRIRGGRLATLRSTDGLPCDTVDSTVEGADGALWLYMSCGVVHVAGSEVRAWADAIDRGEAAPQIRRAILDSRDGAPKAVASSMTMTPRMAIAGDGTLWLAAKEGVAAIDSNHLPHNSVPPPVHIEQLVADGRTYDAASALRLPPRIRDLQIDYTALSLVAPEKNSFRIMLEGRDREWQEVVTRRQAFYTDLGPGTYRFRVVASNNSGVWNDTGAALDFSIAPAYYQTRWFSMLVAAGALVLLWACYLLRLRQVAHSYQRRLDERVNERTRIARELHDTLLQSFQGLLLMFQSSVRLLPDRPIEARERLEHAIDHAAEAIREGRDAVQNLRSSTQQSNALADALRTLGRELAAQQPDPPRVSVTVEGSSRNLHPIVRDETYRIAAEALRNAFLHAEAHHVTVMLTYDSHAYRLLVLDDGKGISLEEADKQAEGHWGISGMRERTHLIGGRLSIRSGASAGTEVELSVPAPRAYAAQSSWWRLWRRA